MTVGLCLLFQSIFNLLGSTNLIIFHNISMYYNILIHILCILNIPYFCYSLMKTSFWNSYNCHHIFHYLMFPSNYFILPVLHSLVSAHTFTSYQILFCVIIFQMCWYWHRLAVKGWREWVSERMERKAGEWASPKENYMLWSKERLFSQFSLHFIETLYRQHL